MFEPGGLIEEYEFSIYDRWGHIIFDTKDRSTGWNGIYNGSKVK